MSYQVLARKWRPKLFQDVVGQEAIVRTLQNALKRQKVGHAYLFTGTRGVGKTSVARLFAKSLLCQDLQTDGNPCLKCASCQAFVEGSSMNFIEIDGASNNSVENIRQLIDNVQYLPTTGSYKVYIIDEVHMLSISAFNALLKTLEEPPAHVVFLFATTEPNKIPQTILSRCQRYDFKNALLGDVTGHLKRICESEGIKLQSDELLKILSEKGNGSIRDALSLLDQVLALSENNMITEETLIQSLGVARLSAVRELVTSLVEGSYSQVSQTYQAIIRENVEVKNLVNQVLDHVYTILQNIDSPTSLYEKGIVNKNALKKVTTAEMFWIYEGLNKDLAWALESINPVKVVDITLKKYTLRRMILNADDTPLDRGEATPEAPRKTWDTFIQNLKENEAGIYTNFERGDLIEKPFISDEQVSLSMAFEHGAQVFYEYFQEKEASDKLRSKISEYFEVETKNVKINFKLLDDEQAEEKNFQSMYSKEKEAEEKKEEEMKQKLLNSDNIKSLEKEFNAKADKVILNK